jgi:hypothetical protein
MWWMALWTNSMLSHMGMKEITFGLVLRYVKSLCSFASLSLVELSTRRRLIYFFEAGKVICTNV